MKPTTQKPTKLPEWKACLDEMRAGGLKFGNKYTVEVFESHLGMPRDKVKFKLGISKIRKELEGDGFYLTGKGGNGKHWVIVEAGENARVLVNYGRMALTALQRGVILGTNTPLDSLTDDE